MQIQQISTPAFYVLNIQRCFSKLFSSSYQLLSPKLMLLCLWNVMIGNNFGDTFKKVLMSCAQIVYPYFKELRNRENKWPEVCPI